MRQTLAPTRQVPDVQWHEVVFDAKHARSALPYVARIARDASNAYATIQRCRAELECRLSSHERAMIDELREDSLSRLNAAIDECNAVGADLVDLLRGIVRFNAHIEGRPTSLVWRLNEPTDCAWVELSACG